MKIVFARILMVSAAVALFGGAAIAQEAAPEASPIVVPDTYLDPLKALEGDEQAFVDQLWVMGDAAFDRIDELRQQLGRGMVAPADIPATEREIELCARQLAALAEYGAMRYSHNARAINFQGNVLYDIMGKQMEGVKAWLTAVSLDSKYSNPYNNLGMHYFHTGRYPLGFQNLDKAMELDPKSPDYCFNMAQNYLIFRPQTAEYRGWSDKRVFKEAMKLSKKAIKLAPEDYELLEDYAVNFQAAENFGVKADWREAVEAWQAARKHAPSNVDLYFTWLNEGRAWRELEKRDEALRCFREALALRPGSEIPERLIAELEAGR